MRCILGLNNRMVTKTSRGVDRELDVVLLQRLREVVGVCLLGHAIGLDVKGEDGRTERRELVKVSDKGDQL
jgi:hypothetical protein